NVTCPTEIYTLSLHDALPICVGVTQSVVSKAIARREARLAGEDVPEEQTKQVIKTCRSFTRMALKFLTEMEKIDYEAVVQTLNRSEEHTSELQSRGHLVCRLL